MPNSNDTRHDNRAAAQPAGAMTPPTRVDPAHRLRQTPDSPPPPKIHPPSGQPSVQPVQSPGPPGSPDLASLAPRYNAQAEQLGELLRSRQHDLDQREALLNARLAQFDEQLRGARLWLTEQRGELDQRAADLDARQSQIDQRDARLAAAEQAHRQALTSHDQSIVDQREECRTIQAQLHQQSQRLAAQAEAQQQAQIELAERRRQADDLILRRSQQVEARREASMRVVRLALAAVERRRLALLGRPDQPSDPPPTRPAPRSQTDNHQPPYPSDRAIGLGQRQRCLDDAEALLAQDQAELDSQRRQLESQRQQLLAERLADRQQLAIDRRRAQAELAAARQAIERQNQQLDLRRAALQQTHDQVSRMHRDALELRLAGQELQVQLAGPAAPALLTRCVSTLRARLADHYALESAEVQKGKAELESLRAQLLAQHESLAPRQNELRQWLSQRQSQLDQQARRLHLREMQLDEQDARFRADHERWLDDRRRLRQQLRELLARLRQSGLEASESFLHTQPGHIESSCQSVD